MLTLSAGGSFMSTAYCWGITVTKHISANFGYRLASRLKVNSRTDRLGLSVNYKDPIVRMKFTLYAARSDSGLRPYPAAVEIWSEEGT